ncbi:MAG: hypothetical protein J6K95_08915 [Rikenellaceae bacterium]|nr:hypothetical protein [Rikenellaceae bacterium]
MNAIRKTLLSLALLLAATLPGKGQQLRWELNFDTQFDNREYSGSRLDGSQTLFGARLTPVVGMGWEGKHSVMIGVDLQADFGQKSFFTDPNLLIYYQFDTPRYKAYAGVFPRHKLLGDYSRAFFSDSTLFYDNNLEGALFQYVGRRGGVEIACDWNGMKSGDSREKFRIFSYGRLNRGLLFVGYAFSMYHFAGSEEELGVVDNILINPFAGLDFAPRTSLEKLDISVGWLQSKQKDRRHEEKGRSPGGVQVDLHLQKWKVGLHNTLYCGKDLMPYWNEYGGELYAGDRFYRTGDLYNRTELYWHPVQRKDIDVKAGMIFHYDGRKLLNQQLIRLSVRLDDGTFRRKAGKRKRP